MRKQPAIDDVHIWTLRLSAFDGVLSGTAALLSADEREHALSLRFQRDRRSYERTRGVLRTVLGQYTGTGPAEVKFQYNAHGKPSVEGAPYFNVSHSMDRAVIAVAGSPVGVDVEAIRSSIDADEISRLFLTDAEKAWLGERPAESRTRDFFRLWAVKEAFLKCVGSGLSIPLNECPAEFDGSAITGIRWRGQADRQFAVVELNLWEGFASALVLHSGVRHH